MRQPESRSRTAEKSADAVEWELASFLGICGTLVVGALGIYLTCRFTGSQILITNAAADTDGTTLLDARTTAKINELSAYIDLYYYEDTDVQDLKDGLYAGLLEGLDDRYSVYYTADEYAQTQVSMTGQYYGIGAGLAQDKGMSAIV